MARFGLFDDTDGFIFEIKNNSFNLVVQRGGVETARIDRLNFNADQLDGQGPSGVVIDLIKAIFSPLGFLDTRCRLSADDEYEKRKIVGRPSTYSHYSQDLAY
jgi:hypothetical protein